MIYNYIYIYTHINIYIIIYIITYIYIYNHIYIYMNGFESDLQNYSIFKKHRLTKMPMAKHRDCCHHGLVAV